jgi:GNAT superfamily N-acetyltransferase
MSDIEVEFWDSNTCIANADRLSAFLCPLFEDDWSDYAAKLSGRRSLSAFVACESDDQIIGLKMGYERNRGVYNSWIGGVSPSCRGRGLATRLMEAQHEWAKETGFRGIETATRQHNRAMGIVNFKGGFVVAGLDVVPGSETKVIFYKDLTAQDS